MIEDYSSQVRLRQLVLYPIPNGEWMRLLSKVAATPTRYKQGVVDGRDGFIPLLESNNWADYILVEEV